MQKCVNAIISDDFHLQRQYGLWMRATIGVNVFRQVVR